ncbi:hypothetical protein [Eikenella corrodens]|uniref:hypothetical protein n=1 Tax=Eikenella corrodens TaxID=539 RepID=UPI00129ABBC9|nr:hypothetical protein [Eikenella corrodens]
MYNYYFDDTHPLRPYTYSAPANLGSLPPDNALRSDPGKRAGFWPCETDGKWQYLPDHRGKTAYQTSDGAAVEIADIGELPAGLTFAPRENHLQTWDAKAKAWVLSKAAASQLLAESIDKGTDAINNLVDEAYRHVTRFQPEYEVREQQARDYKAGGCKGEAPEQVAAFAKPAGKTACEATDIIIAQADNLRMVMGKLGVLRMRKFELKGLKTAAEVDKRTAEILAEIKPIADKLGEVGK